MIRVHRRSAEVGGFDGRTGIRSDLDCGITRSFSATLPVGSVPSDQVKRKMGTTWCLLYTGGKINTYENA